MEKPAGPYCQSCGMPLARDERGGGTEADGKTSADYCSHCYMGGRFNDPELTVEQMMERVRGKLKAMSVPDYLHDVFAQEIPNLRRWSKR